jgi:hypothetical protein
MVKKRIKMMLGLPVLVLAGVLIGVLLTANWPAWAALVNKTINVSAGVNVYVDDQKLDPRDGQGNPVEVFIYDGTTYLPIRAISNSLGIPISWEGATQSVYVGKHSSDKPTVWMHDLDYFTRSGKAASFYWSPSESDQLGNTYLNGGIKYQADSSAARSGFEGLTTTYMINAQYSRIQGKIVLPYSQRAWEYHTGGQITIYGDDEALYSSEVMRPGVLPIDFDVDITGVLKLQIVVNLSSTLHSGSAEIGIVDFGLYQ